MTGVLKKINALAAQRPLLFIISLFLLIQILLFLKTGVFTDLEAEKYVIQGNLLYDAGHFTDPKYIFYLPVILLVYLCRVLDASYLLVVLFQVALSGLSLFYFYKLGTLIGNKVIAFYSSILLALFIPLQAWNFYLYTDSIFISLTIIYTYLVCFYGKKGIKGTVIILLFLGVLLFSRPHGFLFIPPTIIYLLFRKQNKGSLATSILLSFMMLTGMYFLLNAAFTGGGDMDAMKPFVEEHVICFVPMKPQGASLDLIKTTHPVNALFYYIFHNPMHFLRLMGLRLLSFFNMTRSYYSTPHNIFLIVYFLPLYTFSVAGIFYYRKKVSDFFIFLAALLILYPLGTTFQCDDWHSRFTMIVFPYFVLLGSLGLYELLKNKKRI